MCGSLNHWFFFFLFPKDQMLIPSEHQALELGRLRRRDLRQLIEHWADGTRFELNFTRPAQVHQGHWLAHRIPLGE